MIAFIRETVPPAWNMSRTAATRLAFALNYGVT
jgi:hypothetical protein